MGASSGKSIRIFASLSNLGSEEWNGSKETLRQLPHLCRRHLSPLLGEICVWLESFRPGLSYTSEFRGFVLHTCTGQSSLLPAVMDKEKKQLE